PQLRELKPICRRLGWGGHGGRWNPRGLLSVLSRFFRACFRRRRWFGRRRRGARRPPAGHNVDLLTLFHLPKTGGLPVGVAVDVEGLVSGGQPLRRCGSRSLA